MIISYVARRGRTQLGLLATVLAVMVVGATLVGTCALLLTTGQRSALEAAFARAEPDDVAVVASFRVSGLDTHEAVDVARGLIAEGLTHTEPVLSAWVTSDVRRLSLPGAPYAYLTGADDLAGARLLDGRWPRATSGVIEVAVPRVAVDRLGLGLGNEVVLEEIQDGILDIDGEGPAPVTLRVVGVYAAVIGPTTTWGRDLLEGSGFVDHWELPTAREQTQVAAFGPFFAAQEELLESTYAADRVTVHARPDIAGLSPAERAEVRSVVGSLGDTLRTSLGDRARALRVSSDLGSTISSAEIQHRVTGSAILTVTLLGTAIAAAALGLAGRLVVARRSEEVQLLASRGARRSQLVAQASLEGGGLAVVAAVLAIPLSMALYRLLGGLVLPADAGVSRDVAVTPALVCVVASGALLLATALVVPAWRAADRRPPGRRSVRADVGRRSVDLLLAAGAAIGYLQLRGQRFTGAASPDPMLVVAPLLMLLAGAVIALRVLPWISGHAERRAHRSRRLVVPLASWEVARRSHSTGAALLLILATASGTFGLALGSTWAVSTQHQADARVGTDLAVTRTEVSPVAQGHALAAATGGLAAPVIDRAVELGSVSEEAEPDVWLVAPPTTRATELLRGRLPVGTTWDDLTAGLAPATQVSGVTLAADARTVLLTVRGDTGSTSLQVLPTITVQSPGGARDTLTGTVVPLDGALHELELPLPARTDPAAPGELDVVAVALHISLGPGVDPWILPRNEIVQMAVDVTIRTDGSAGPVTTSDGAWSALPQPGAQELVPSAEVVVRAAEAGAEADGAVVTVDAAVRTPYLVAGPVNLAMTAFDAPTDTPVVIAAALAQRIAAEPGDMVALDLGGFTLSARVIAVAAASTPLPHDAAILADHDAVSRAALAQGHVASLTDTWWMAELADPEDAARAIAGRGLGEPVERAALAEALARDPLRVGVQASLWLLVGAAAVLALAGTAVQTASALEARAVDVARLQGIGVSRRSVALALLLEHTGVSVIVIAVGALVGAATSWLVGPLLVVSPAGAPPVPYAQPQWFWADQGLLLGALLAGCAAVVVPVAVRLVRRTIHTQLRLEVVG